ncbi:MAG: hypothetical protein KatS3mg009_1903 [Acidimicrobiia bacterium]|nr:MAG: hypothetical protein KatS3mg009_1903 [Acidimicrobiia bacterium]
MLDAIARLIDDLDRAGVAWCSWKSNAHLDAALAGDTDLDVLVARADASAFREVLARNGVKALRSPPGGAHPGMEHYLGFDERSGRLFHVHVHHQLVLGQKHVKNYRVPIELPFLASCGRDRGVPVPAPELELAVLVTRVLLKYRIRDLVKDVLHVRTPGVGPDLREEIDWLTTRTDAERVVAALEAIGAPLPSGVVRDALHLFARSHRDGLRVWSLRTRMRRALRPYARHGSARAALAYARGELRRNRRFRLRPPELRMTPRSGGTTVALVGADGAGKSTGAESLADWLGWKLVARTHYLGAKPPSPRSRAAYLVFRALRRGERGARRRGAPVSAAARPLAGARDVALAAHYLSVGADRARRHRRAVRDAAAGTVVLYDRFPLCTSGDDAAHLLLDGPQIAVTVPAARSRPVVRSLAALEERIYRRFHPPDQLVFLHVDPDVAHARKPDHRLETVATKCRAVRELEQAVKARGNCTVTSVDANRPAEHVIADLKREVWRAI